MSTTTIRLDDDLRRRLAASAERVGKTPHSFILDAVAEAVSQAEFDDELQRLAEERFAEFARTTQAVSLEDATAYALGRARGERPARPKARPLGR